MEKQKSGHSTRNHGLDKQKFIAEILVVFIHIHFPGYFGEIAQLLPRYAVPFFFMVAGYFCFSENPQELRRKLHKRIAWLAEVIVVSCTAYFIWKVFRYQLKGESVMAWLTGFSAKEAVLFVCFNYVSFFMGHLWYLFALLYVYVIMLVVNKYQLYRLIYKLLPAFFALQLIVSEGAALLGIDTPLALINNFVIMGIPNFFLGNYVRAKREKLLELVPSKEKLLAVALIGEALAFISWRTIGRFVDYKLANVYAGTTIAAIAVFLYAVKYGNSVKESALARWGERYLLFVYVMHPMVGKTIEDLTVYFVGTKVTFWNYLLPPVTCVLTLGLGAVFYWGLDAVRRMRKTRQS